HAKADKAVARRIKDYLRRRKISVWLDEAEIRVGESIPQKVAEGLSRSNALCILVSENALRSKWVMREFNSFLHRSLTTEKMIFPCRLDSAAMPELIQDVKFADFTDSFEVGISGIVEAIAALKTKKKLSGQSGSKVPEDLSSRNSKPP